MTSEQRRLSHRPTVQLGQSLFMDLRCVVVARNRMSAAKSRVTQCCTAAVIGTVAAASPCWAQGVPYPDQQNSTLTIQNIDPVSGAFSLNVVDLTMGAVTDSLPIVLTRTYRTPDLPTDTFDAFGQGWSHSLAIGANFTLQDGSIYLNVFINRISYQFGAIQHSPGNWTFNNIRKDGGKARSEVVNGQTYTVLTTYDGFQYYFPHDAGHSNSDLYVAKHGGSTYQVLTAMVDRIVAPNGEQLKFTYSVSGSSQSSVRLEGVRHSRGYGVIFKYIAAASSGARTPAKQTVSEVVMADTICPTFPFSCNEAGFRRYNYQYSLYPNVNLFGIAYNIYALTQVITPVGSGEQYTYSQGAPYSYNRPLISAVYNGINGGLPVSTLTYGTRYQNGSGTGVTSISLNGNIYSFAYPQGADCSASTRQTKRTAPNGAETIFRYPVWNRGGGDGGSWTCDYVPGGAVSEVVDPLGRVTKSHYSFYVNDPSDAGRNQLLRSTSAENNNTVNAIDERGNITSVTNNPKPGSEMAPVITHYNFQPCTTANFRWCNRPTYVVDGNGSQTDFVWSDDHGGLISTTLPPNPFGQRRTITNQFSQFTGSDGAIFYLKTSETEPIGLAGVRTVQFDYNVNQRFQLDSVAITADGQTRRTCYGYDAQGNRIWETRPRAGLTSCY